MLRKYLSLMFLSTRGCCKQEFQKRDTIEEPHVCCCKTIKTEIRGWFSCRKRNSFCVFVIYPGGKNISFMFHCSRVSFILSSSSFQAVNTDFFCLFLILFFDFFFFLTPTFFKNHITLTLYLFLTFPPKGPGPHQLHLQCSASSSGSSCPSP